MKDLVFSSDAEAIRHMSFSRDGNWLVCIKGNRIFMSDVNPMNLQKRGGAQAGDGAGWAHIQGATDDGRGFEPSFSPDGRYVVSGHEDNSVRVYRVETGERVSTWSGHVRAPTCAKWAPRNLLVATGCYNLALWVPDLDLANLNVTAASAPKQEPRN